MISPQVLLNTLLTKAAESKKQLEKQHAYRLMFIIYCEYYLRHGFLLFFERFYTGINGPELLSVKFPVKKECTTFYTIPPNIGKVISKTNDTRLIDVLNYVWDKNLRTESENILEEFPLAENTWKYFKNIKLKYINITHCIDVKI